MLPEEQLKTQLQWIADHDYQLPPGATIQEITAAMMTHLGSADPDLRDSLIYETLTEWADGVLSDDDLRWLHETALDDDHLFCGIGQRGTATVFMRSFSLLTLAVVLDRHRSAPLLGPAEVMGTLERLGTYIALEQDLRGYTGASGWAHAAAHAADVFDELAQCPEIDASGLETILGHIGALLLRAPDVFIDEEDERLAVAVLSVLRRAVLDEPTVVAWLGSLVVGGSEYHERVRRINSKQFLRSLYFQASYKQQALSYQPRILEALQGVSRFR